MMVKVTFQNEAGEYNVHMTEETATAIMCNTPFFSVLHYDAKADKNIILMDEILEALKIMPQ